MGVHENLPFKVGQLVESRSFQPGFRGAWFRGKIKGTGKRRNSELGYDLEFLDFPDEKYTWTKLYQKPQGYEKKLKHQNHRQSELMVRPSFPHVYRESEMPDVNTISEEIVVVNDIWKVGDLVDWWKDDCYWSGSITKILDKEQFQIDLLPPPLGEGLSYEACSKDFRPSLDWSLERGWTVPTPTDSDNGPCARIVIPVKPGKVPSPVAGDKKRKVKDTVRASQSSYASHDSSRSPQSRDQLENSERRTLGYRARKAKHASETNAVLDAAKTIFPGNDSSSYIKAKSSEIGDEASVGKERLGDGIAGASKPRRKSKHEENQQPSGDAARAKTRRPETTMNLDSDVDSSSHDTSGENSERRTLGYRARNVKLASETNVLVDGAKTICPGHDSSSHVKAKKSEICDEASVGKERLGDGKSKHEENQQPSGSEAGAKTRRPETAMHLDSDLDSSSLDTSGSSEMGNETRVGKLKNEEEQRLGSLAVKEMRARKMNADSGIDSRFHKDGSAEIGETLLEKNAIDHGVPSKKSRIDQKMSLNSMFSDTTEASILDLEELLQRVKWMKGMLQNGKASSNATRPPWKFIEHRG